ncbi:MAG: alpha-glucosidase [Bacilli bacterium]|jgi:glycosidase|nr:alpha-glucosidase [Erysipelotrichia bacterium]
MNLKWWQKAVGYIIYPRSFKDTNDDGVGDLKGIISKLDYLKELGVDLLWICPFFASPMDDNGYDVSNYYEIDPLFGTNEDFDLLIKEAHARNIRVIVDFVLNHTSDEHEWFKKAQKDKNSLERDYYFFQPPKKVNNKLVPPNNWKGFFSTSAWTYDELSEQYYLHIFSKKMPDVNWANPSLRQKYYEIARFYLNKGVDGFRLDALAHLAKDLTFSDSTYEVDQNGLVLDTTKFSNRKELFDYMDEFKKEVFNHYEIVTIGEVGGQVSPKQSLRLTNYKNGSINIVFNFDTVWQNGAYGSVEKSDEEIVTDVLSLKKNLMRWYNATYQKAWLPLYWSNHDHPRVLSQYGSIKYRNESAKMLITVLLFLYGTPFIHYGDEIGMSNVTYEKLSDFDDVNNKNYIKENKGRYDEKTLLRFLRRTSRVNARTPMQWDDTIHGGFSNVPPLTKINSNYKEVNVKNNENNPDSILNYYKRAIKLRKNEKIQQSVLLGKLTLIDELNPDLLNFKHDGDVKILCLANFRDYEVKYKLRHKMERLLLHNYQDQKEEKGELILRPFECYLFEIK